MYPYISVIVNCYNGEKYLESCLNSIVNQNYKDYEVIIWDNASTDNSKKIVKKFKDKKIKYFRHPIKENLYMARNRAIEVSSGQLIAFLDCDDWWDCNYLSSREKFFNNNDYDVFYNNVLSFYEKNNKFKKYKNYSLPNGKIFDFLAKDYFIIISGSIIRKKVFDKIGKFNSKFNIIGDFEFIMKASKIFNFHGLNEPLVNYRVHEDNFSKRNTDIFYEEFLSWYKDQCKINDEDFKKNKKYFTKKLLFLEINHLLLNKKKNLLLFKKILKYPNILQMLKFIIGFMLPKKIIRLIKN